MITRYHVMVWSNIETKNTKMKMNNNYQAGRYKSLSLVWGNGTLTTIRIIVSIISLKNNKTVVFEASDVKTKKLKST